MRKTSAAAAAAHAASRHRASTVSLSHARQARVREVLRELLPYLEVREQRISDAKGAEKLRTLAGRSPNPLSRARSLRLT